MVDKRKRRPLFIAALCIAMVNLNLFFRSPESQLIRTVHIAQLLSTGVVIGVALTGLIQSLRRS